MAEKKPVSVGVDAEVRLADLGVPLATLTGAIEAGEQARSTCTTNDPPATPGFLAWARTVRRLRELLATSGWVGSEEAQLSTTNRPDGMCLIAVNAGDAGTGREIGRPKTKRPKGPATLAAVEKNYKQLSLFAEERPKGKRAPGTAFLWLLLVHRDGAELRAELSLPRAVDDDNRVVEWEERILLPPLSVAPTPEIGDGSLEEPDEIEVPVHRKGTSL